MAANSATIGPKSGRWFMSKIIDHSQYQKNIAILKKNFSAACSYPQELRTTAFSRLRSTRLRSCQAIFEI